MLGLSREEISTALAALDVERYRADQIYGWIYAKGETDFEADDEICRRTFDCAFRTPLESIVLASRRTSNQSTARENGSSASKTVMRRKPFTSRKPTAALCVSSQVGCTLTCAFCHTGTQRLVRNLEPGEIVGQIMLARDHLEEWPSAKEE